MTEYITMVAACIVSGALSVHALHEARRDTIAMLVAASDMATYACVCADRKYLRNYIWQGRGGDA